MIKIWSNFYILYCYWIIIQFFNFVCLFFSLLVYHFSYSFFKLIREKKYVLPVGIEPTTFRLALWCSAVWIHITEAFLILLYSLPYFLYPMIHEVLPDTSSFLTEYFHICIFNPTFLFSLQKPSLISICLNGSVEEKIHELSMGIEARDNRYFVLLSNAQLLSKESILRRSPNPLHNFSKIHCC